MKISWIRIAGLGALSAAFTLACSSDDDAPSKDINSSDATGGASAKSTGGESGDGTGGESGDGTGGDGTGGKVADLPKSGLFRIATMPSGAEVTGITMNEDGELFLNAQHPDGKDEYTDGVAPAVIGYMHDFDALTYDGPSMDMPGESERADVQVADGEFVALAKAGELIHGGTEVLGGIYDQLGTLLYVSNDVDHNSFVKTGEDTAYLYTGWEGAGLKGASSVSRLNLKKVDGQWTADLENSMMVDLMSIKGAWVLCYGYDTEWDSTLFAEEYYYLNTALWNLPGHHDGDYTPYFIGGSTNVTYHIPGSMTEYLGSFPNPYDYGWVIEMSDRQSEAPVLEKHFAMGRYSHENGVVLEDKKTVYLSDDDSGQYNTTGTNSGGAFFKFVADTAGDMTAGTLYAAKATQKGDGTPSGTSFDLEWIELASGDNATIEAWIDSYDSIDQTDYVEGSTDYISTQNVIDWAESKRSMDLDGENGIGSFPNNSPAFLESRKAAAFMGATVEWNKLEGVATDGKFVYVAVSSIGYTMGKDWGDIDLMTGLHSDTDGHIAMDDEACGAVYAGEIVDGDVTKLEPVLVGEKVGDVCVAEKIANPDNVLALEEGLILVGEDSGMHDLDMLWLWRK